MQTAGEPEVQREGSALTEPTRWPPPILMDSNRSARPVDAPFLGVGVGLRPAHYAEVLDRAARRELHIDWFEALSENYMVPGGRPRRILDAVRSHVPVTLHGVSMNLGSVDALNSRYLDELGELVARTEPSWVSDHLCWTGVDGLNLHDLIPLPYTDEVIRHVAQRILRVQDRLGRRIAVENVSSYFTYVADSMPEWEFLAAVTEEADCGILLDVNNVFVSAHNHGFDPMSYINGVPPGRVFELHLGGHSKEGSLLIDTHDHPVRDEVWDLFAHTVRRLGPVSTLIEWDDRIPSFARMEAEAEQARTILEEVLQEEGDAEGHPEPGLRCSTAPAVATA